MVGFCLGPPIPGGDAGMMVAGLLRYKAHNHIRIHSLLPVLPSSILKKGIIFPSLGAVIP